MWFTSDNAGPAAPEILAALAAANSGCQPGYGADAGMARVAGLLAHAHALALETRAPVRPPRKARLGTKGAGGLGA